MQSLKTAVQEVIKYWNQNVKDNDPINGCEYSILIKHGDKDFYTNKKDFYTLQISEIFFISKIREEKIGLWRREILRPKDKHLTTFQINERMEEQLYKFFMYECIGNFSLTTEALIRQKELAPYDLSKNRLLANPEFKDTVIEVTENGEFYKEGDQFDIFNQLDTGWIVFTECEIGKANNGLAKIEGKNCKVIHSTITPEKIDIVEPPKLKLV
jgi:hypothetical protein